MFLPTVIAYLQHVPDVVIHIFHKFTKYFHSFLPIIENHQKISRSVPTNNANTTAMIYYSFIKSFPIESAHKLLLKRLYTGTYSPHFIFGPFALFVSGQI